MKTDPEKAFFWRDIYSAVRPAYHQNKRHWITVVLDGTIPAKDIRLMIAESYDLIADSPTRRIYEAVKRIPYGRVATYSQVAELAGEFAFGGAGEQAKLLAAEGIEVTNDVVDLSKYQWNGR